MLSNARIRELLPARAKHLSDADLAQLAEGLYTLARHAVATHRPAACRSADDQEERALALLSADDRDTVEERAAVLEFDGKMDRDAATRTAIGAHVSRHRSTIKDVLQ